MTKPRLQQVIPLPDGTAVPLTGRKEHLEKLYAHKEHVVRYIQSTIPASDVAKHKMNKKKLTITHSGMAPELHESFYSPVDLELRENAQIIYVSMRLAGKDSAADMAINLNRVMAKYTTINTKAVGPPVNKDDTAHVDANVRKFDSPAGSKTAMLKSSFGGVPGCLEQAWAFILDANKAYFD